MPHPRKRQRLLSLVALTLFASPGHAHLEGARHPAHQARHQALKRDLLPQDGPSSALKATNPAPVVDNTLTRGRYGHSAAYLKSKDKVLFIGGQLGESGNYITNDIVALDLSKPYPCPSNPSPQPALAAGLPPHAWAASAVDDRERVWLIGGVTQDCNADSLALILDPETGKWTAAATLPIAPPRRRQAQAVAVESPSGNKTFDLHVFGGIAEQFTCSDKTVGYTGLDTWGTSDEGNVTMRSLVKPEEGFDPAFLPPISDYAVVRLVLEQIVFIGGQRADGSLVDLRQILVYHTLTDEWELKITEGDVPSSRMGHVAFSISDTQLLLHGGVGADKVPSSEVWMLDAPPHGPWTWSVPAVSNNSIAAPPRAWHSATRAGDNLVVIGYGIDTASSSTSNDLFFLTREFDSSWTWCSTFNPPSIEPMQPASTLVPTTPPAPSKAATAAPWKPTTSIVWASSASPIIAVNADNDEAEQKGTERTMKAVVGSIGGVLGAALLAALVGVYLRKRANDQGRQGVFSPAPPVSALQYTRPAHQRNLSLGSTLTAKGGQPDMRHQKLDQNDLLDFLYPATSSHSDANDDPFGDSAAVMDDDRASQASASVHSYPYLTALPMAGARTTSSMSSTPTIRGAPAIVVESPSSDGDSLTRMPSRRVSMRRVSGPRLGIVAEGPPAISPLPPSSPFALANSPSMLKIVNSPSHP